MGYDTERLTGNVIPGMMCAVCRELFQDPKELQCQHVFCLTCLNKLQNEDGEFECPMDRKKWLEFSEPNQFFKDMYFDIQIRCQWHRFGCEETLVIGSEQTHELEKCRFSGFISRPCPRACGFTGPQISDQGMEHDCVHYLKDLMWETERKLKFENRMLNLQIGHLTADLEEKDVIIQLQEQQNRRLRDQLYPCARAISQNDSETKNSGSGDA